MLAPIQITSIPKIQSDGSLNQPFAVYIISYFVVVNWTLLQVTIIMFLSI